MKSVTAPREDGDSRLQRYTKIEMTSGEAGAHPATKALHARPATRGVVSKAKQFARIERGHMA